MVKNETVKLVESGVSIGTLNSLSSQTPAIVESTQTLSANEADFQMSRVMVECQFSEGPQSDTTAEMDHGPFFLFLCRGDVDITQLLSALNEAGNVDLTPIAAANQASEIAIERAIVLMIPFKFDGTVRDEAAAEYTARFSASYNGPPLGMSLEEGRKRSYVFPKNVGWKWGVHNAGVTMDDNGTLSLYARSTGRYLDV